MQDRLWVDRSYLTARDGSETCAACSELRIGYAERDGVTFVGLDDGRLSDKDRAIQGRLIDLEPSAPPGHEWLYILDNARTQFEDGIGCYVSMWRALAPAKPQKRRTLP